MPIEPVLRGVLGSPGLPSAPPSYLSNTLPLAFNWSAVASQLQTALAWQQQADQHMMITSSFGHWEQPHAHTRNQQHSRSPTVHTVT